MIGNIHQVSVAPPVIATSTRFIAISMDSIEMSDIPMAVLKAVLKTIWRDRTIVSKTIDVSIPLIIASSMIQRVGQGIPVSWK
jgi:hypothetical protein